MISRQLPLVPYMRTAGFDIGGGDEHLHLRLAHAIEINQPKNEILQGIDVVRIEVVGAGKPSHAVEHHIGRRCIEAPAPKHRLDR